MERTVLEEMEYEYGLSEEQSRRYLGAFLFHGDEVLRLIGSLSGGEQSRLAFLKLMLTGANFLVLDEPTNHLDIPAKEAVEEALSTFPGTYITVSHDRYFLDKVANCVLEIADGRLQEYNGNYSYYREKKAEEAQELAELEAEAKAATEAEKAKAKAEAVKLSDRAKSTGKALEAKVEKNNPFRGMSEAKRTETLQRTEAEIAMAEAELKMLEMEMNDPAIQADPEKSMEIAQAYSDKEAEIQAKYEKWEQLSDL